MKLKYKIFIKKFKILKKAFNKKKINLNYFNFIFILILFYVTKFIFFNLNILKLKNSINLSMKNIHINIFYKVVFINISYSIYHPSIYLKPRIEHHCAQETFVVWLVRRGVYYLDRVRLLSAVGEEGPKHQRATDDLADQLSSLESTN